MKRRVPPQSEERPIILQSESLFKGRREIIIEHDNERYRLRITSKGKLLLNKWKGPTDVQY
jgi:hemin uptake protein HemP